MKRKRDDDDLINWVSEGDPLDRDVPLPIRIPRRNKNVRRDFDTLTSAQALPAALAWRRGTWTLEYGEYRQTWREKDLPGHGAALDQLLLERDMFLGTFTSGRCTDTGSVSRRVRTASGRRELPACRPRGRSRSE